MVVLSVFLDWFSQQNEPIAHHRSICDGKMTDLQQTPASNKHQAGYQMYGMIAGATIRRHTYFGQKKMGEKSVWMDKIQHKLFGSCETETNWKVAETWGQCAITRSKPYCPSSQFNLWEELLKYISPYYFNKQTVRRPTVFANEVKCERKKSNK